MGAIGGLLGTAGGANGTGFASPQAANITNPVTSGQISSSYTGAQGGLTAQQNLLSALQAQNGLSNQNQVYGQLQGIASGAVNPAQTQFNQNTQANIASQAALMAGQRGSGSNVGLIARQAAQQGANTQQQAVGQEATQQATNQINATAAAGNLATTQAGQQIGQTNANTAAQQAEQQSLLNAQQAFNAAQVGSQQSVNAGNTALAGTSMQGQQGMIGGVMNAAGGVLSSVSGGASGTGYAEGGDVDDSEFDTASTSEADTPIPSEPIPNDSARAGFGPFGGSSSGGRSSGGGGGGMAGIMSLVAMMADGGGVYDTASAPLSDDQWTALKANPNATPPANAMSAPATNSQTSGPQSKFGKFMKGASKNAAIPGGGGSSVPGGGGSSVPQSGPAALNAGMSSLGAGIVKAGKSLFSSDPTTTTTTGTAAPWEVGGGMAGGPMDPSSPSPAAQPGMDDPTTMNAARGGKVPAMVSPGERFLKPNDVKAVAKGQKSPLKAGEKIPGKPKVGGAINSYRNDTVPKNLVEGGIVLPRSVTQSKTPAKDAAAFVAQVLAKRKTKR
jgi:hypothetical protein